jgi:hypothetical protein
MQNLKQEFFHFDKGLQQHWPLPKQEISVIDILLPLITKSQTSDILTHNVGNT